MKHLTCLAMLVALGVFAAASVADEKKEDPLKGAKCPVSGQPAKAEHAVDYNGGKAYFCCPNCPKAFKAETAKFATKANHQLVLTSQTTQKACPLSGGKLNPDTAIEVAGAKVAFCCPNCKAKVEKAEGDEQLNLAFSDAAYKKAFEIKKAEK